MIPRPLSDAAARHNPGRWVCNTRPEKCNGIFRVYGQDMACPIRDKCWAGRRNTYEHTPGGKLWGRYPELDTDGGRRRQHANRLKALKKLWAPPPPPRTAAQREAGAARTRKWRAKHAKPHEAPETVPSRPLLPCGEDCEGGCPYETCPYTDDALDALEAAGKQDKLRAQAREKHARERTREAQDPDYKAHRRELDRVRSRRYYQAHKDVLQEKARKRMAKKREARP